MYSIIAGHLGVSDRTRRVGTRWVLGPFWGDVYRDWHCFSLPWSWTTDDKAGLGDLPEPPWDGAGSGRVFFGGGPRLSSVRYSS